MKMLPEPPEVICEECEHYSPPDNDYSFCRKNASGYSPVTGKLIYVTYPTGEPFSLNVAGKCSFFVKKESKDDE